MHLYHVIIAAIGGVLFIIIGIARQRERARIVTAGKKTESAIVWTSIIIAGACLLIFAAGVIIYQLNHH
jgi:membrane protein insertase Oxa1/YidC/SpoIIIJ